MSNRYADKDIEEYNISASQVKTHSKCPMQYWMRYVEGKENTKKDSDYVKLGSRVHETLEDILGGENPPPFYDKEILTSIIQNHYAEKQQPWLPEKLYNDGLKCCQNAAEFIHDKQPNIRGIEKRTEFEITRPDMSTGVTAIMDVITEKEIWDWKTGRIRDDTEHEERIQGSIYMAAFYHLYGETPEVIRFVYIKEGKVRTIKPTDKNWNYMLERAINLLQAKKTGEFPSNPGDHCFWCGYEYWCPDSPVGVGNVSWEDY